MTETECKYATMTLKQPWGDSEEQVRIFPPCQIKNETHRGDPIVVFAKYGNHWERKRIGYFDMFPLRGFVAWDDSNQEYAWHEVGTIDVPGARDPNVVSASIPKRPDPTRVQDERKTKRKRRSFRDWFLSKSNLNDAPDFLRKDN